MKKGEINVDLIEKMGDDLTVVKAARVVIANPTSIGFDVDVGTCKGSASRSEQSSGGCEYRFKHLFYL